MSENKEQEMSFVSKVHFIDDIPVGDGKEDLFNIAVVYKTDTKFDIELIGDSIFGDNAFTSSIKSFSPCGPWELFCWY